MHPRTRTNDHGAGILILIWLLTVLGLAVANAHAGIALPVPAEPDPGPGTGELELLCSTGRIALPAVHTDVDLHVTGPLIRAIVRQKFINPADEVVSARYVFPLPPGAAVAAMELQVGERRIVSIVKEKEAARAVYEQARKEGRKAALVSSARRDLFVTEVANIGPGEQVSVRLEYLEQAGYEEGWFTLAHPLTFTPRFFPPAASDTNSVRPPDETDRTIARAPFAAPGDSDYPRARITVSLTPGLELADIRCPSHEADLEQEGDTWWIAPVGGDIPADRDFLLRWRPADDPLARPLLFTETAGDATYALLMVVPGDPDPRAEPLPTDTVFVIDVSGSMGGESIEQAKRALLASIDKLRVGDRFALLAFDDRLYPWTRGLEDVTPRTLIDARRWVRGRQAQGGTMMNPALMRARLMAGDEIQSKRARQIILLTDASVGNEDQLLREAVAAMGDVRLHVVGIGSAPNRHLVRRLAGEGGGESFFVAGGTEDLERLSGFLARIGRPQWVDPELNWLGTGKVEGYPSRLPAPTPGTLVLWSGRLSAGAELRGVLRAEGAAGDLRLPLEPIAAPAGSGLATRWARLKVDDLLASYDVSYGDESAQQKLRADVVATALKQGLVTRFTSRVAVELVPTVDRAGDTRDVKSGLPKGSTMMGELPAGGTLDDLLRIAGLALLLAGSTFSLMRRRRSR